MQEELLRAISVEYNKGTPTHLISEKLVSAGWPKELVNQSLEGWMNAVNITKKRDENFKNWLHKYFIIARPAIITVVCLNLVDTTIALLKPWPVKIIADSVFGDIPAWGPLEPYTGTTTLLLIASLMTISLFVIGAIFGTFRDYYLFKIGFGLNRSIKEESFRHILHLPLFHQERLAKGDYVYRQNVVTDSLSQLVLGTTSAIIQSILVILGVLGIMLLINPELTIIAMMLLPLLYITIKVIGPKMGAWAQKYTENKSETSAKINEAINNAEAIQAFTLEEKTIGNVNKLWLDSYNYGNKNMMWGELLDGVNGFLVTLATSAVLFMGGTAALNAQMSFGDLLIFMTYMGYLIGPVEQLIDQWTTRNQKLIDVSRIHEVMTDHEGIEVLRQNSPMPTKVQGTIEFNQVSYTYNDRPVFQNLNFTIPAGQKIGIIGPSGGGKSTILKLLPLFIEPASGSVTIDGVDIQSVSLKDLRKKIAWVSQSPQLFNEDIFENLLEGDADRFVSNEEIANAVDVSNITEFVAKMPLAFRTPVGEDGGSLSGGQRQRISIGRALIKNAPIICLDEPTAALDVKSENYIRDSLAQMVQGKTVLMVTHRKPLLALMDVIYVLENGALNDVRNLGGLDTYLAKLDGIELETAVEEINLEQQGFDPDLIAQFLATHQVNAYDSVDQPESDINSQEVNLNTSLTQNNYIEQNNETTPVVSDWQEELSPVNSDIITPNLQNVDSQTPIANKNDTVDEEVEVKLN
jgi:ABC-type bacteriocin/lantibiotic exporter with double-glycine peptidase domain